MQIAVKNIEGKVDAGPDIYYWFVFLFCGLYFLPLLYLIVIGELDFDEESTREHLSCSIIYILTYLAAGAGLWALHKGAPKSPGRPLPPGAIEKIRDANRTKIDSLASVLGWLSVTMITVYYASGGYMKILSLGSTSIDSWEYRLIGFVDVDRLLVAFFEMTRRIMMPYAILVTLTLRIYGFSRNQFRLIVFVCAGILGAIVNLDRGPIFLYLVMFFFIYFFTTNATSVKKYGALLGFTVLIGVVGSTVTFLQYNIVEFDLSDVYHNFFAVILGRLILDPVRVADIYAFGDPALYGKPLYLEFSRLGALFGREYVGTDHDLSTYVTPVGLIGDVWRNFGMLGAVYISFAHGLVFRILARMLMRLDFAIALPIYFLTLVLSLYLFYAGMFSQGPFALLGAIIVLVWYSDSSAQVRKSTRKQVGRKRFA